MIEFCTPYDVMMRQREWDQEVYSDPGERFLTNYHPVYDDKGVWHLEEDEKKIDTYLDIQSHADSVDLKLLLARYRNGEVDILNQVQGWFGDIVDMPTNYADILNAVSAGEDLFKRLDPSIKEKFDNDFVQFVQTAGSDEWFDRLGVSRRQDTCEADQKEAEEK